ncbi:MAG: type II toxin-antitoxin system RelE/ParE family toxin [Cyanobacteria bacterium J06639_1]
MTPQFRLTEPAIADIEEIADYLARQSGLSRAEQFLNELDKKLAKVARFPNLGKRRDEILLGIRSLPLDRYLILYVSTESGVDVLRVVSGYRDLTVLFDDRPSNS